MSQFDVNFTLPGEPIRPPKSTVISIIPWEVNEFKPGLIPGNFRIPASVDGEPQLIHIPNAIHYVYIDHDRGSMRVENPSYKIARSIVNDYNSAQMEAQYMCHPGMFWEPNELTIADLENDRKLVQKMELIREVQQRWFEAIVRIADDDWEKTRQHFSISDFQRIAVKQLDPENKTGRQWVMYTPPTKDDAGIQLCPACGSDIPIIAFICRYCSYVLDPERYAGGMFARKPAALGAAGLDVNEAVKNAMGGKGAAF